MKKFFGIVGLGLLLCNVGAAEIKLLERELINQGSNRSMVVSSICIDGYKFVTVYDKATKDSDTVSGTTSITQMFVRVPDKDLSLPQRCGWKKFKKTTWFVYKSGSTMVALIVTSL